MSVIENIPPLSRNRLQSACELSGDTDIAGTSQRFATAFRNAKWTWVADGTPTAEQISGQIIRFWREMRENPTYECVEGGGIGIHRVKGALHLVIDKKLHGFIK